MPDLSKPTLAWALPWDADWVTAVAFLGPTRRVAAGNNLGQILLWELPAKPGGDPPKPILRLDGHTNVISKLAATPDGKTLLSASYDHTVRYWDGTATAEPTETVALNAVAIASVKGRSNKVPAPLAAKVGVVKPTRTLDAHKEWVVNLDLTRDGKSFITGDDGGHVIVWDREPATIVTRWRVKGWAYALALSPDKKQACVGERVPLVFDSGRHAGLKLWDATAGTVAKDLSADFKGFHMSAAAYSPDGKLLAVARGGEADGTNGTVTLLDPASGKKLKALTPGHLNGATDVAFHPDGKHLASAGRDTVVRVWGVESGKLVSEVGKPRGGQFKDWVHAVSWSADGRWLAAADMAGAVQVWTFG
jgi:WD40 repeat protein